MTDCPACGTELSAGVCDWHMICARCSYEGSSLEARILDQAAGGDLDETLREDALQPLRTRNFARIAQWIRDSASSLGGVEAAPKLLDVGCAHGWFLQEMSPGFTCVGIEPDPNLAHVAGESGMNIRTGFFPEALDEGERYDVVVFNDVLEHIPDIDSTLAACFRHLNPGGLLVVNAPDADGFLYRLSKVLAGVGRPSYFERLWQKGFPSPHVHYLDSASVQRMAVNHGFLPIESHRLASVSAAGLHSRIRYSKDVSAVKAAALTLFVGALIPFLSVLPSDIRVWILRKPGVPD